MCGIAGKLALDSSARVEEGEIQAMLRTIAHRGPDGNGVYLDGNVGLGHCRLSIIDLSTGDQPMSNEDGTVWIIFNGEIYNFQELRERLVARGHIFKSRTDTEVIIHLYEDLGPDCVTELRGMFAFAIWDSRRRRLVVARDRVGIKPLYYCQTGRSLLFASEFKAILTDPAISRELNLPAIRKFLAFNYVPGEETLFNKIHKLPPGHYLVADPGKFIQRQYWDLAFIPKRDSLPFESAVEELHALLASTVRDHMIADVPVGVLLSGGVDSSAVLSFAINGTSKRIKTFTVGFDAQVVDERPYARLAANKFGTEHFDLSISPEEFWKFLLSYVHHMEEPVCEPPAVALYYISKLARQHVKVLLSGEGGDEAFAGYPNYPNMLKLEFLRACLGPLAPHAGTASVLTGTLFSSDRLQRYGAALGRSLTAHYFSRTSGPMAFFNRRAEAFLSDEFLRATSSVSPERSMARLLAPARGWSLIDQMLYVDTKTWLPDDLLVKADKMTMANSVELRVPLLDHRVLEFAASLPDDFKVRGRETKRVLKAAFAQELPPEILARKKMGFPVPYSSWLRTELKEGLREVLLSPSAVGRGYFRKGMVERMVDAHTSKGRFSKEVFSLLVLELWHRRFADSAVIPAANGCPNARELSLLETI